MRFAPCPYCAKQIDTDDVVAGQIECSGCLRMVRFGAASKLPDRPPRKAEKPSRFMRNESPAELGKPGAWLGIKVVAGVLAAVLVFGLVSLFQSCDDYQRRVEKPRITLAMYEQLRLGTKMDDVYQLLGNQKEVSRIELGRFGKQMITWANPDGSSLTVDFDGGLLESKSHLGLR